MHQTPVGARWEPSFSTEPADYFLLDDSCDRRLVERIHRLIQSADYDLCGYRGEQWRTVKMSRDGRIADGHRILDDRFEDVGELFGRGLRSWQEFGRN